MVDDTVKPPNPELNGYVVPPHGRGLLRPSWKPGQSGNPGGVSGRYQEVQRLARVASPEVMRQLIAIALDRNEETRARIVAMTEVLGRAWGKVRAEPDDDTRPVVTIDAGAVSDAQLERLQDAVRDLRLAKEDAGEGSEGGGG